MINKSNSYPITLFISLFYFVFFVFITNSCRTTIELSNQNLSYLYNPNSLGIRPDFVIYHINDSITRIYFKFNSSELLYIKQDTSSVFQAKYSITCKTIQSYNNSKSIDSLIQIFIDNKVDETKKIIKDFIDIKVASGKTYLLELAIKDENRPKVSKYYFDIDKRNHFVRQNFILTDTNDQPVFRNYVTTYEKLRLKHNSFSNKKFLGYYYYREFQLAPPPFSTLPESNFNPKPDSIFTITFNDSSYFEFNFKKKGIYHILHDTNKFEGFTIFVFYNEFPKITTAEQMLPPIRYLVSKNEYQKYVEMKNKKDAIDEFWLQCGGNQERARELIRRYYNRVQEANKLFTSYKEGWKTDRGMIYLIFGVPNFVYRTNNGENWIYGEENNVNSLTFSFVKIDNPFTDNDYMLIRLPEYRISWYNSVELWRR